MLWVNRPSVFMGRYQWAEAELGLDYLEEHNIALLRRTSGGGTVYHDLGNLNFTAIKNDHSGQGFDLRPSLHPYSEHSLGVVSSWSARLVVISVLTAIRSVEQPRR